MSKSSNQQKLQTLKIYLHELYKNRKPKRKVKQIYDDEEL